MENEIENLFPKKADLRKLISQWADEHGEEFVEQMQGLGEEITEILPADKAILEKHLDEYYGAVKNRLKRFSRKYANKVGTKSSKASKAIIAAKIERQIAASLNKLEAREQDRLNQKLDMPRQKAAGISKYVWVTRGDGKVRKAHKENNAKIFSWSSPSDETGHPGKDWGCRCRSVPVKSDDVKEFVEQELVTAVNDSTERWNNIDFLYNAQFLGKDVTLSEIGHLGDIINYYAYELEGGKYGEIQRQIVDKSRDIVNGKFNYVFYRSYDFTPVLLSHGDATVTGVFSGSVKTENGLMYIEGEVRYSYTDLFTDPISVRQRIFETSDPFAVPKWVVEATDFGVLIFKVTDIWETKISGKVKLNKKESLY